MAEHLSTRTTEQLSLPAKLATLATVMLTVFTLTSWTSRQWWLGELFCNFPLQYATVALICAVILLWQRCYRQLVVAALVTVLNGTVVIQHALPRRIETKMAPAGSTMAEVAERSVFELTIMYHNLNAFQADYQTVINLVETSRPDVLVCLEVTPAWVEGLAPLRTHYPHGCTLPRENCFGVLVWTTIANCRFRHEMLIPAGTPTVFVTIPLGAEQGTVQLVAIHTLPPLVSYTARARNEHLRLLAARRRQLDVPRVVVGDLNMTCYSPFFGDFLEGLELYDTRRGLGLLPSWPRQMPLLWIGIDHVLASHDVVTRSLRVLPATASDHYPLEACLAFPVAPTNEGQ